MPCIQLGALFMSILPDGPPLMHVLLTYERRLIGLTVILYLSN